MNYRKIFWGLMLIILGVLFLLNSLDVISISLSQLLRLWPIILVLWGISVLPVNDLWKVIISLVVIALTLGLFYRTASSWNDESRGWPFSFHDKSPVSGEHKTMAEPFDTAVHKANLTVEAGVGVFRLGEATEKLIDFTHSGSLVNYSLEVLNQGDSSVIDIHSQSKDIKFHKNRNTVDMKLNTIPEWRIDFDAGMAEVDLDLSLFMIRSLEVDGGMSTVNVKIGNLQKETALDFETGFAKVSLSVPKEAGCRVNIDGAFNDKDLEGFTKVEDGLYQTENFSSSQQKVEVSFDAGFSKFDIRRY